MKRTSHILFVFTLMNFVVAMMGFVFNGILDKVALSLNITVANSGLLNTMYAYGAAFGVPITLIVLRKIERIKMLKIMLFITILMTLALIYAMSFGQLLITRLIMGISANSYSVLATSTVLSFSSKERRGRSMAILIMGASLALVVGVPLTRVLSAVLDWRSIFWILNILMMVSLIFFQFFLPKGDHEATKLNLRNELIYFKDKKTVLIIIYTITMFVGYNALFTYVTPYLLLLFPSLEASMSMLLVIMGIASFIGNYIGGQVSDRIGYAKSMQIGAVLQLTLTVFIFISQSVMWLSLFFIILWIMSAWFTGLQLNTGIAQETQNRSSFIISINSSALSLGSAIGSSFAAVVIPISGIQNIVIITIFTNLGITLIQWLSMKKYSGVVPDAVEVGFNENS